MQFKRKLGRSGPEVTPIGLGTVSFSHAYGPADSAESLRTLDRALELGCNLLDTADSYGAGENEAWLGQVLKGRRDKVVLSTKAGFVWDQTGKVTGRSGHPDYIRRAIDASLKRLQTDVLDLCTLHRVDPAVPIEDSVGVIAEAVAQGKVHQLGLSEVQPSELLRALAIHPVAAVQSEFSLWTRDPEDELIGLSDRHGVAFVAFSPLGRGMFATNPHSLSLSEVDFRRSLPRFQSGNLEKNAQLASAVHSMAARRGVTASQIALAWVLRAGPHVFAIPGTRSRAHVEENMRALNLSLTPIEIEELDHTFTRDAIAGDRYAQGSVFGTAPAKGNAEEKS